MRDLYPEDLGLKQFSQRFVSSNFDPTRIRPIVSAQQIRPKGYIQPSIEVPEPNTNSPPSKFVDTPVTHSPKRPFPAEDFEDHSPRKLARGESPLKGAAGRRMDQQKRQNVNGYPQSSLSQVHPPPPPPLPGQINFLLSIIPKASTYVDARFDPVKMVELMRDVRLPPPGSLRQPEHQPSPSWPPPPQFQHQQPPPMHAAFPPPGQSIGQSQYSAPFRYG
jgi:cleavage stimulation factor subunit 3